MEFDHRTQRPTTGAAAARPSEPLPGKRTLTEDPTKKTGLHPGSGKNHPLGQPPPSTI